MQTTMIRASMTAYSTAVGPSSRFRNVTTFFTVSRIGETSEVTGSRHLRGSTGLPGPLRCGVFSRRGGVVGHGGEGRVGVLAKGRDRGEADDDDQRQHHGVFHGGRAVLALDELDGLAAQRT